ncbi:M14 family zinc carboxypeptidase [Salinisphaera sp. T31B1]|uniref:M14 family zinc carboxypeptidase n=1 Tax=Salinisphaera sp. T31B1 TaxID=727963 RepID=UPI00333F09D6
MTDRSFKAQVLAEARPRRGLLVAAWLGSMVLVALVAVLFTAHWSNSQRAPLPPQAESAPQTAATGADSIRPATSDDVVTSSPDTVVAAEQPNAAAGEASPGSSDAAGGQDNRTSPDEQADMTALAATPALADMQMAGGLGLVSMPAVASSQPPSDRVAHWCRQLAEQVAGVESDDCMNGAFRDTGHRSVDGRPMVVRDMPASSGVPQGRVLLISATHGDEPSSIATVFEWMALMADNGTPYEWHVVPTLNPDGALHQPATRVNANGVDLNRNLPTDGWARESRDYWRRVGFEKRRFPGASAGSEPENRWLAEEIESFQPNVIISLHAPYGVLDYDGNFPPPQKLGRLDLHRLGVYPGSLGNFASHMRGIPVITVELDDARQAPDAAEVRRMWADLNGWLDRYLRSVRQARADTGAADNAG